MTQPCRAHTPQQMWLAVRIGWWLCVLPILLRLYPLPSLLQRLTAVRRRAQRSNPVQVDRAVQIVVWMCQLRLFRLAIFPRACLRQALTLSRVLTQMGYPVEIHFGIHKEGDRLLGHSWVTVQGQPVAERARTEVFRIVYSYPSTLPEIAL